MAQEMRIYEAVSELKMEKRSERREKNASLSIFSIILLPFRATFPIQFSILLSFSRKKKREGMEKRRRSQTKDEASKRYRKMWLKFSGEPRCQFRIQAA
jgi:hypothetical protein